jgi:hypothetical protein
MINVDRQFSLHHYRRIHQRYRVDSAANVLVAGALDKPLVVKDVSARGAQVLGDHPFCVNERIELIMLLPHFDDPVRRSAKVVWSKKIEDHFFQAGIDFGLTHLLSLA